MDTSLIFSARVYNSFEQPTKLIKLRATLPQILLRPEVYQHLRVSEGCRDAVLALGRMLNSHNLRLVFKNGAFPKGQDLLQLEKKFGDAITVKDREGVALPEEDDASTLTPSEAADLGVSAGHGSRRQRPSARKAATDSTRPDAFRASLNARATATPVDYISRNIADLPVAPPRAPLPDWYLQTLPPEGTPVYSYSGQRLNSCEVQKAALSKVLHTLGKQGTQMTYCRDFMHADSMGEDEALPPQAEALSRWDTSRVDISNADGTQSLFRIAQPSARRREDLMQPWGADELAAAAAAEAVTEAREQSAKPRFDANPSRKQYLDEDPAARFRSIFQQTEEGIIAEHTERVENTIQRWCDKLVVDDPVLHVSLRSSDKVPQADRYRGLLHDEPHKRSLRSLYRAGNQLTGGGVRPVEPSIFTDESTAEGIAAFENSLRPHFPEKWVSTRTFTALAATRTVQRRCCPAC